MQPEFLASVMDEMAGLTSEISEEIDKTSSTASVTGGVEVTMAVPEVTVVAPEESLESAPATNGDGKSEEVGGARIMYVLVGGVWSICGWGLEYLWVG